jgi:copper chaperone CopZ
MHQWSGNYNATGIQREYQDKEYCPECKKAIVDALSKIPVKFEYKGVQTAEVDLETLKRWEEEFLEEQRVIANSNTGGYMLPIGRRVFAKLVKSDFTESQVIEQVIGREDKEGRIYVYSYWPSKIDECIISVQRKVNLITGEPGEYKIQK